MSRERLFADGVRLTERLSVACCLTLQRCMSVISVSTRQKRRCTNVGKSLWTHADVSILDIITTRRGWRYQTVNSSSFPRDGKLTSSIIMGLDRNNKSPCGFAFVEYYLHSEAVACMRYISGTKLDERIIRCDLDPGYKEGRQFGRGKSGGQVRDEFRQEYDSGRGKP